MLVNQFLRLSPQNEKAHVMVPPHLLNSFLRILEIMNRTCTIDLVLPDEHAAGLATGNNEYRVKLREPYNTKDTNYLLCNNCLNDNTDYCKDCKVKKDGNPPSNHRIKV